MGKASLGQSGFKASGKSKKKPPVGKASGKANLSPGKSNPFEERNNGKAKHSVLNRRVKGGERNVAKARENSNARRMKTLLVEHKNRKVVNAA